MGLDKIERRCEIAFDPPPRQLSKSQAIYALKLEPGDHFALTMTVRCTNSAAPREPAAQVFSEPYRAARRGAERAASLGGSVTSSNELANRMLHRAGADLSMLVTETPQGPYPYAGTPWFSTPFGRDGLITALEMLWLDPSLAKGVLRYLAAHQATELDERNDAEPGKILHETRSCEMAVLGEVPFGHYYGSIDSTPLFVWLASAYFQRTGDRSHDPRAVAQHRGGAGLDRQIWRPRWRRLCRILPGQRERPDQSGLEGPCDSIMHADGQLAPGSIALCEVQGYVYAAQQGREPFGGGVWVRKPVPPSWPSRRKK